MGSVAKSRLAARRPSLRRIVFQRWAKESARDMAEAVASCASAIRAVTAEVSRVDRDGVVVMAGAVAFTMGGGTVAAGFRNTNCPGCGRGMILAGSRRSSRSDGAGSLARHPSRMQ